MQPLAIGYSSTAWAFACTLPQRLASAWPCALAICFMLRKPREKPTSAFPHWRFPPKLALLPRTCPCSLLPFYRCFVEFELLVHKVLLMYT